MFKWSFQSWVFSLLSTSLVSPSAQGAIVHKPRRRAATVLHLRLHVKFFAIAVKLHITRVRSEIRTHSKSFSSEQVNSPATEFFVPEVWMQNFVLARNNLLFNLYCPKITITSFSNKFPRYSNFLQE